MANSIVDADTILAIDIGSVNTRALLFDVAEGQYRFVAAGRAATTAESPYRDVGEGVRLAVDRLQTITGRVLVGSDENLLISTRVDGSGVDVLITTISTGPNIQLVAVGLLADVSLESAQRLANSTYGRMVETIGLNDRRKTEAQINAILRARPDIIILAGGTEGGANRSVSKLLELVGLSSYLLPNEKRPHVLFAGNQALEDKVKSSLQGTAVVDLAPNIRPAIDQEDLSPAQVVLEGIVEQIRGQRVGGLQNLSHQSARPTLSTAAAFGRMIRYYSRHDLDPSKGVLGIDVGAGSTTVAAAFGGRLNLNVQPIGMGQGMGAVAEQLDVEEIAQWLPMHVPTGTVRDYLYHKQAYPATIPVTLEESAIEQAIARQIIRQASRNIVSPRSVGASVSGSASGVGNLFEHVIASGAVLTQAPTLAQSLMMLLDGLQPIGATNFWLDQNNLLPALGAIAEINSILPVQIAESGALVFLGKVISPVSSASYGTPILRVHLKRDDGTETRLEVKQGSFHTLPLARGQSAQLLLESRHDTNLGLAGPVRGFNRVLGGPLGVVIDARGRPLNLPGDAPRRREMIKKWLWTLGG